MRSAYSRAAGLLFVPLMELAAAQGAPAAQVSLIGVLPGKAAVLVIDGSQPTTVRVGRQAAGVRVLAVERDHALIEVDGRQHRVALGPHHPKVAAMPARQSTVLAADSRGHFIAEGLVNGSPVRFLLDTGATMVSLPARDAQRLGLDYRRGKPATTHTANGVAFAYLIKLDTVKLGDITLSNVDAMVLEGGLETALLGMSFLNRVELRHEGQSMTLTRRF